jgi:hypothetical protein
LVFSALQAQVHRGISPEKLPLDLGFFDFFHNTRKRGKALLFALSKYISSRSLESIFSDS